MVVGSFGPYGARVGVHLIGTYTGDHDLPGSVSRYDIKDISFNRGSGVNLTDSIKNIKTLKWNDTAVVRENLYGPKSMTPRFGVEGEFFLTDRARLDKAVTGKMNKAGDIVELSKLDVDAVKEMRKDFPYVERFLRKISKFILR